jgi:quinoprotein glucose dehydrogenase
MQILTRTSRVVVASIIVATIAAAGSTLAGQTPARSVADGVYTEAQATRGRMIYADRCAACHGEQATGDSVTMAPALVGETFTAAWKEKTVGDLFSLVRDTMPQNEPGALTAAQYADVLAHILSINNFPRGTGELEANADALKQIRFSPN